MKARVLDGRHAGWFWCYNELLDVYGPELGIDGVAVYVALARVAKNSTGECVITLRQIAEIVGTSPQTAMRALAKLVDKNLVRCEEKGNVNTRKPSIYTLIDMPKSSVPIGNRTVPNVVPSVVPNVVPIGNTLKTINTNNTSNTETPFALTSPLKEKDSIELPEWLPIKEWEEWKQDRKERKIPTTPKAQKIAIADLDKLRKGGEDPAEVLRGCIIRGWRGIFTCKRPFQNGPKPPVAGEEEDALAVQKRREQARKEKHNA
jgi:DNA-binding transcriptional ArsR family regulator